MKKDKAKQRKLYDTIGILCGVVVIMLGVLSNVLAPKTPAGTVLAVADAEARLHARLLQERQRLAAPPQPRRPAVARPALTSRRWMRGMAFGDTLHDEFGGVVSLHSHTEGW